MTIRALLFDVDDTLYDFSETWRSATERILSRLLQPYGLSLQEVWPKFVAFDELVFSYVNAGELTAAVARRLRWQFLEVVWSVTIPNLSEVLEEHQHAMMDECVPFPDTIDVIAQLAQRFTLGLITNGPASFLPARLTRVGLAEFFPPDVRIAADAVGYYKPEPEIFRFALDRLGVSPAEAIYIGDSWTYDVLGAQALNLPVVWFNPRGLPCPDPGAILADIRHLSELLPLLDALTVD